MGTTSKRLLLTNAIIASGMLIEGFLIVLGVLIRIVGSCYWALLQLVSVLTKYRLRISLRRWSTSIRSEKPSKKVISSTSEATASAPALASTAWQKHPVIMLSENSPNESTPRSETIKSSTLGEITARGGNRLYSVPTSITPEIWL